MRGLCWEMATAALRRAAAALCENTQKVLDYTVE
jgi:hypothetical protein